MSNHNIDSTEIAKFSQNATHWWDKEGPLKSLHDINPLRLGFIDKHAPLKDKKVIDVGCGGGILSESMAKLGAIVTGIDMSKAALETAKIHLLESNLEVEYLQITAEDISLEREQQYDIVTCLELLEHVPDPFSVIQSCAKLVKPNGHVFFSTINRNLKAYLFAIVGAEHILKLLPEHTHDFAKFIRPSELADWSRQAKLQVKNIVGMTYNVFTKQYKLCDDVSVNYIMHLEKNS